MPPRPSLVVSGHPDLEILLPYRLLVLPYPFLLAAHLVLAFVIAIAEADLPCRRSADPASAGPASVLPVRAPRSSRLGPVAEGPARHLRPGMMILEALRWVGRAGVVLGLGRTWRLDIVAGEQLGELALEPERGRMMGAEQPCAGVVMVQRRLRGRRRGRGR
jgi:hypothetical protein